MQTNSSNIWKDGESRSSSPVNEKQVVAPNSNSKHSEKHHKGRREDSRNNRGDRENKARVAMPSLSGPFVSKSEFASHQVT